MNKLISPELDLAAFCARVQVDEPLELLFAASEECSWVERTHKTSKYGFDLPKGSRAHEYCENLERVISMATNGEVPADSTREFLVTVKPLFQRLLRRWKIGNLREVFSTIDSSAGLYLPEDIGILSHIISRAEVEAMDTSTVIGLLNRLIGSPETARRFVERVDISFQGYDDTRQELFEIPEVRNFVYKLDGEFPYWLYFLSKQLVGLKCLLLCFLPPFLTEDGRSRIFPERIRRLLENRWLPAMNHICAFAGMSEKEVERLSDRAIAYCFTGRLAPDS